MTSSILFTTPLGLLRRCRLQSSAAGRTTLRPPQPPRVPRLRANAAAAAAAVSAASVAQDAGATAVVMGGAFSLVLLFDTLTDRKLIEQSLSRKVVHVLSGLLFLASWPFFSSSPQARYFAAVVPLFNCMRLISYGLCLVTDEGLVKSITREGKPEELLRGPLYYVLVLTFCVLVFWRDSPVGILVLAMMSGGDGFADIVGRRYGMLKLPYNRQKSWVGSISMFIFGFLSSVGMLYYYSAMGYLYLDLENAVGKVALVSLVATMVESLPITETIDDNISVPVSTILMAMYVFGHVPPH
ncbi:putative phytol kinase, chloroplastic [Iris pallida]|uniref:phytol kinase n=1 Tax=Iris pallida TaxID=29817 RepID=A0AAX6EUH7_IRIPA|nr:putative phytol kinase, chloroplastic [Iris pallida]KAJ6829994.1 putative phytol kinase, chloroplastic [Iris pallida]